MVMHHEMAHFRWIHGGMRSEYVAHARGSASLMDDGWPTDRDGIIRRLESDPSGAWYNEEIRDMILKTKGGFRLMRAWGWRRRQVVNRTSRPPEAE